MYNYIKDYPRPQLLRSQWENLNGTWDFAFDDAGTGISEGWHNGFKPQYQITVPFTYETKLSGIGDPNPHSGVWYSRTFTAVKNDKRLMLHFEGSDWHTRVFVNGQFAGEHKGGYARFSFDITEWVKDGQNRLTVYVTDSFSRSQPRGKQRWKKENFGCWYVQTTGIWKTVWIEYVPTARIDRLKLTPDVQHKSVHIDAEICGAEVGTLRAKASFEGITVGEIRVPVKMGKASAELGLENLEASEWGVRMWSPESPDLYDLEISFYPSGEETAVDCVNSYFGLREISIHDGKILLNGAELYQRLILDQGYWPDSHLTPPSEQALIEDIDKILALGYNGLRKHQKTEDERFLYWCDRKGVLVWSEFPATYRFDDEAVENMTTEWMEIVRQNYNHPSIITWTPFNESWGVSEIARDPMQQHFTQAIYYMTKALDPMRPVICNDGWRHTVSDIITLHDYAEDAEEFLNWYLNHSRDMLENHVPFSIDKRNFAFASGFTYRGQPIIISEFGGIAFTGDDSGWGYGNKVATKEDFIRRFDAITTAIKQLPYCCGYCYTQVTDVQQEVNGLMTPDRQFKIEPEIIAKINLK